MKRIISLITVIVIMVSLPIYNVFADDDNIYQSFIPAAFVAAAD